MNEIKTQKYELGYKTNTKNNKLQGLVINYKRYSLIYNNKCMQYTFEKKLYVFRVVDFWCFENKANNVHGWESNSSWPYSFNSGLCSHFFKK